MIGVVMKVSLASGIILAMPYITFQILMFVLPALTKREKKYIYIIMPWVTLMFVIGVVFGYFVLIPPAINFLLHFGSDIATPQITINNYISLISRLLLAVGLVFEMPVVTTFLARIGIVNPKWLADKRKIAIIIIFIVAAIITPTLDPVNQTFIAVPLILLYEMSIWLAKLVYHKKKEETVMESP
jgi:sec-independent protein translocase protein TatC